jgi:hypothetical protein
LRIRAMLWSICPVTPARGNRRLGLKLRLSQNVQPPVATVPSTFGQVNPASMLTFCTRSPNRCMSE